MFTLSKAACISVVIYKIIHKGSRPFFIAKRVKGERIPRRFPAEQEAAAASSSSSSSSRVINNNFTLDSAGGLLQKPI